jgi:hypothetical protein
MNIRLLFGASAQATRVINGRSYTGAAGTVIDVYDADAQELEANGWIRIAPSGPTSARPNGGQLAFYNASPGATFYDTTIGKYIIFDGQSWRDTSGSSV